MVRSRTGVLAIGLSIAVLGGILGLAINNRLPWQTTEVPSNLAIDHSEKTPEDNDEAKTQQGSKITFQEALRIAEATVKGKAYSMEREIQDGEPVIEVSIDGKEIFVDASSGKVVLIEDLYQKGDPEDIEEVTEALRLQKLATIPIQQALQTAERFAGKQAHTVGLENEDGNLVYEVVVELQEIYVDAGNGQLLYTETLKPVIKGDAPQPSANIQAPTEDSSKP